MLAAGVQIKISENITGQSLFIAFMKLPLCFSPRDQFLPLTSSFDFFLHNFPFLHLEPAGNKTLASINVSDYFPRPVKTSTNIELDDEL